MSLSKLIKKLTMPLLTLGMASCGMSDLDSTYHIKNSVFGTYHINYNTLKNTQTAPSTSKGDFKIRIYTIGSDARVRFRILSDYGHTYDRHPMSGEIYGNWEEKHPLYPFVKKISYNDIAGNISNNGKIDLMINILTKDLENNASEQIIYEVWGKKISDEIDPEVPID